MSQHNTLMNLVKAVDAEMSESWECASYHPSLWPALEAAHAAISATQPAQAAQPVSRDVIRDVFLRNGFTIKDGCSDLKPYVYAAANALLEVAAAQPVQGVPEDFVRIPRPAFDKAASALRQYSQAPVDYHRSVLRMRDALRELTASPTPPAQPAVAQGAGEVVAWCTPDGERCVTARTYEGARKDGGAMWSSMAPFTVPAFTQPESGRKGTQMSPTTEKLWCIHIPGPDDLYAAPSHAVAERMAECHNKTMQEFFDKNPEKLPQWGLTVDECKAQVIEWTHGADEHAEDLADFDANEWSLDEPAAIQKGRK